MSPAPQLRVSQPALHEAAAAAGLSPDQAEAVWTQLAARPDTARDRIVPQTIAWYGGGTVSLLAMTLFLGTGWSSYGPGVGLIIAIGYLAVFLAAGELFRRRSHPVPAGLMATVAVGLVPLVVFAVQDASGWAWADPGDYDDFYAWIDSGWSVMEAATLVAAAGAWWRYRFSFLLAPAMVAGWFASMDVADALAGDGARTAASGAVAAGLLLVGAALDRRVLRAEAFWAHLGGLLAVCYTLGSTGWETGVVMTLVGVGGAAALAVAVVLRRRLYLTFGGLWLFSALGYLSFEVFGASLLFPVALAALGVGVVLLGVRLGRVTGAVEREPSAGP